ncbi:hypothetical protein [Tenacibaculum agarivorans]|uniref:hypothetical protein n=1 Tax=Tenacibaculum agarivorans TaxID=1908389 RepID=UPI00094B89B0|nr:hypothetical protein [Tenacibaculum agarivorans]
MGKIIHKTKPKKEIKKEDQNMGFKIIFFALNFLLVPFSAYTTFKGYSQFLGIPLAIVLALATGLMFFGLNYAIMTLREEGKPHFKQSVGFLLPLMISFFGNFPHFYGNQMQGSLLNEEVTHYKTTLTNTYNTAINKLERKRLDERQGIESKNELDILKTNLDADLKELKAQIQDGGCKGMCRQKWEEIRSLFMEYNKVHNGTNNAPPHISQIFTKSYNQFENLAMSNFKALLNKQKNEIENIDGQIDLDIKLLNDTDYSNLVKLSDTLLMAQNEERLKIEGGNLLKRIKATNDDLGQKASKLPGYEFTILPAPEEVNTKNIKGVLESAFIKNDNSSATIFSIILSLIIDLAVLGFVFLILSFKKVNQEEEIRGPNIQTLS